MSTLRTWNPLGVLASTLLEYSLGVLWDPFRNHLGSFGGHLESIWGPFWGPFWHQMASRGPGADWTIERSNHMCFFDQSATGDHIVSTKWHRGVPFATYTVQVE